MAEKGKVKIIKDPNNSGGGIPLPPSDPSTVLATSGSTTTTTDKGTVDLSTILVTVTSDRTGLDSDFNVPYYGSMNLNVGDQVRFTLIPNQGKPSIPVYIERNPSGTIKVINADNVSGVIVERISNKLINFYQAHLSELQIHVGDDVDYTLIYTTSGEMAVNLQLA